MANVRIEKLDIVVTLDETGEASFERLFQKHMQRWKAQMDLTERLRCEAEQERTIFGAGGRR